VSDTELKYAIEALLFASERPLTVDEIQEAFSAEGGSLPDRQAGASGGQEGVSEKDVREYLAELKKEYETQSRGFKLFEIAGGWQLVTDERFSSYLKKFYQSREKKRLSRASLETLSVIAYKQPVTRADIEAIRGVNVDGALKTLLEKGLARIAGRKEVPGRPILYRTTKEFLEHFGLNSVKELPPLKEFTLKDIEGHLLPPELNPALPESKKTLKSGEISDWKGGVKSEANP